MSNVTLHYLYDPFCGWCYGASPLITAAGQIDQIDIQVHGIGMLSGENSKIVSPEWRDFVRPHEERITAYSHQVFAEAYVKGVLESQDVLLDSSPPIGAMLTAEKLDGRGLEMLKRLQRAYYIEGRPIATPQTIAEVAEEQGYDTQKFMSAFEELSQTVLGEHLEQSRTLMERLSARGVPAFFLEVDGEYELFHFGHYLGKPADRFKGDILKRLVD